MPRPPASMHLQDRLLLAEALIAFAGDARNLSPRERRAWELVNEMLSTGTQVSIMLACGQSG